MKPYATYILFVLLTAFAACSDAPSGSSSDELARAEEAYSESDFAAAMNIAASALDLPQPDSTVCGRHRTVIDGTIGQCQRARTCQQSD